LDENGNGNTYGKDKKFDGNTMKVGVNYGSKIGKEWRICKSYIRIFYQKNFLTFQKRIW
jgi:hypothetical protein